MRTTLQTISAGCLMFLVLSDNTLADALVERHQAAPLIAKTLTFLPNHPAVRQNKDLQQP
jgi:hypothetical protein